ncbi:hypothetical protein [Floridanema evergladense]|uniref:Uncharacterized protein n=1 Tax=Floridaenema evergladense BLCC-F167 TaxID=3153639 RepID=A0ABV4WTP3_9CYAN
MKNSDLDTINDLEKLRQKIGEGITKADEILNQAREVKAEVSEVLNLKSEVENLLRNAQTQLKRSQKLNGTLEIRLKDLELLKTEVESTIYEVGDFEKLSALKTEIETATKALAEANESNLKLEKIAEERQKFTEEQIKKSEELVATIQTKLLEQVLERVQLKEAEVLHQLESLGDTIRQQDLLKLKLENMEKEQQRQSKLLKRGIWTILVILGVIAILLGSVVVKLTAFIK